MSLQKTILPARAMFAGGLMLAATLPCATIAVFAAEVPPAPKPAVPIRTMLVISAAGRNRRAALNRGISGFTVHSVYPSGVAQNGLPLLDSLAAAASCKHCTPLHNRMHTGGSSQGASVLL